MSAIFWSQYQPQPNRNEDKAGCPRVYFMARFLCATGEGNYTIANRTLFRLCSSCCISTVLVAASRQAGCCNYPTTLRPHSQGSRNKGPGGCPPPPPGLKLLGRAAHSVAPQSAPSKNNLDTATRLPSSQTVFAFYKNGALFMMKFPF